jgi:hypothetical protein
MGGKGSGRKKETAHDKRKRLLTVVPKKRGFRCYGCGRSGNELHIQLQVVCLTGVVSNPKIVKPLSLRKTVTISQRNRTSE